jgi:hypothetical protein
MLLDHAYANSNVITDGDVQELEILLIELKKVRFVTQVRGYEVKLQKVKGKGLVRLTVSCGHVSSCASIFLVGEHYYSIPVGSARRGFP